MGVEGSLERVMRHLEAGRRTARHRHHSSPSSPSGARRPNGLAAADAQREDAHLAWRNTTPCCRRLDYKVRIIIRVKSVRGDIT